MYILLSGYLPFNGDNASSVFMKIQNGEYSYKQKIWRRVSKEAKALIDKMLEVEPRKRLTGEQCLLQDWFKISKPTQVKTRESDDLRYLSNLIMSKEFSSPKKRRVPKFVKKISKLAEDRAKDSPSSSPKRVHPKYKRSSKKIDYIDLLNQSGTVTERSRLGDRSVSMMNEEHNLTRETLGKNIKKLTLE